jgi:hypothetical protein
MAVTNFPISGTHGELRYHAHTVCVMGEWTRGQAHVDGRVGTTVARLTFRPSAVNQFWANFGQLTHVAFPTKQGGKGPRRVYELIECDLKQGKASFRTPHIAVEGERK